MQIEFKYKLLFSFSVLFFCFYTFYNIAHEKTGFDSFQTKGFYGKKNSLTQEVSSSSRRAIRFYEEGKKEFRLLNYGEAKKNLERATAIDDAFIEAFIVLGEVNQALNDYPAAIRSYERAIEIDPLKYPEVHYFAGLIYFEIQYYRQSIQSLERFLELDQRHTKRQREAEFHIASSIFAMEALKNPVPFDPQNLGDQINSEGDEFINAVSSDELLLYFTRKPPSYEKTVSGGRFFYSIRSSIEADRQAAQALGNPFNTGSGNEGALTITYDRRYILFAGCHWTDGLGSCDIYAAQITGGNFGQPQNLGSKVNSAAWDSQPSLAPDGRTLYFASNRQGGFGRSDIWRSYLQDDGKWSTPENLGEVINTYGSEMAPFIHADGKTLYFSSDRHPGMGGIDLFVTRMDEYGKWSKPVNLGYPVNTAGDEINIIVNTRGNKAYISANLPEGYGGYDIYEFELHEEARPTPATYLKGIISDADTGLPLEAYFLLINLETGKEVARSFSDARDGDFLLCIPTDRDYALHVSKDGYLFFSENFALSGFKTELDPYIMNISLQPIKIGETVILKNIFFDTGKHELKRESIAELNKLHEFMENNPKLSIEITGHTDNVGAPDYNIILSQNRAKAVFDFLIEKGIDSERLGFIGVGAGKPVADNETEEGRAKNRRTEIGIVGIEE